MPGIQDLDRFQSSFRSVGGEAETLMASGSSYEELPLPKEGEIDAELASLLDLGEGNAAVPDAGAPDGDAFEAGLPDDEAVEELDAGDGGSDLDFGPQSPGGQDADFSFDAFLEGLGDELEAPGAAASGPAEAETEKTEEALPEVPDLDELAATEDLGEAGDDEFSFDLESFARGENEAEASAETPSSEPSPGEVISEEDLATAGSSFAPSSTTPSESFGDVEAPAEEGDDLSLPELPSDEETPDATLSDDFQLDSLGSADLGAAGTPEASPFDDFSFGAEAGGLEPDTGSVAGPADEVAETAAFEDFGIPDEEPAAPPDAGESGAPEFDNPTPGEDLSLEDESFSLFAEEAPEPASRTEEPLSAEGESPAAPLSRFGDDFDFSLSDIETAPGVEAPPAPEADAGSAPEALPGEEQVEDLSPGESFPELEGASGQEPMDSFDMFRLDDDLDSSAFGLGDEPGGGSAADEEGFAHLEDFSLEGLDDVFKSGSSGAKSGGAREARRAAPAATVPGAELEVEEIVLTDDQIAKLQSTLASYPLSLRIACEELIVEQAVAPEQMSALVKLLVSGADPRETAALAGRILGRTIVVPRGFVKRSAEDLEAEKRTLRYALVHQFLPIFRIFAAAAAAAALLVFVGIRFVYFPLKAESLYKQGYTAIPEGQFSRANERFDQALRYRVVKPWFYRYAEAFRDQRQYLLAEGKYDQLLHRFPRDKKGALDYARMETEYLRNYEKAARILKSEILDWKLEDKDALLALGDNYLAWGEIDPIQYEEARKAYARLIGDYGRKDPYLERMLLYFIRTDQLAEVLPLQAHFMDDPKRRSISSASLAEMGGYLFDKKTAVPQGVPDPNVEGIEDLRAVFAEAIRRDPTVPEAYYHFARYLERYGTPTEQRSAIDQAVVSFTAAPESSLRRLRYHIDALRRLAELMVQNKEFLNAEKRLDEGMAIYEDALNRNVLSKTPEFGRLYADFGDIEYFYASDPTGADAYYQRAEENGWSTPELQYRRGYVAYVGKDWGNAVERFYRASADLPLNRRLLFALGNALYERGDLYASQGYYNRLLDVLEAERSRFPVLVPHDRPEHAELVDRIMRARNNLAVVLAGLADRSGDERYRNRALALFAESELAWDTQTRDPKTMDRSRSTNLAFLNTRGLLYPTSQFEATIYPEIDKDVQEPSPWEELLD